MQITSTADADPKGLATVPRKALQRADLQDCLQILRAGSKSFHAASLLLPSRLRAAAAALYAFCRVADDAVDDASTTEAPEAVDGLHRRLRRIYAGAPYDDPVDRAFSEVVLRYQIPRSLPNALIEGFAWDAEGRCYETLEDLEAYCVRVASTVGVMMTLLMGPRNPNVLARACDLGIAMQLTNIARDVGEDARAGRVYLPMAWLRAEGVDAAHLRAAPRFDPALGRVVQRLLNVAQDYYERADHGITMLPRDSRVAIRSASLIYRDIGRVIALQGFDSVSTRAHTSKLRKLFLLIRASAARWWRPRECSVPPRPAAAFLVQAAAGDTVAGAP